jgi:WD40 repeat protein
MFSLHITRWLWGLFGVCLALALIACASVPSGQTQATATSTPAPSSTANVPTRSTAWLTYHGHARAVSSVAWSPDGKRIASGGDDSIVRIWDAATGHADLVYRGHTAPLLKVAWSPDGKEIASSDQGGIVQVWQPGL